MPRAVLTESAETDVEELLIRSSRRSDRAAARLRSELKQAFRFLSVHPRTGTERPDLSQGLYSRVAAGWIIVYYRIIDDGVLVERVLSGSRVPDPTMFED